MTYRDLKLLLYGDARLHVRGYHHMRRISLSTLGLDYDYRVDDHPANFLFDFAMARQAYYDTKCILFQNTLSKEIMAVRPVIRGDKRYADRQLRKFKRLERWASENRVPIVHLRLGLQAPDGMSAPMALALMRGIPNRLLSFLQSVLPYRPRCVWCIEPTKRGICHFHMLFFGSEWLIKKEVLDDWWRSQGLGTASGVWIERLRGGPASASKMVGYLVKYVSKPEMDPYWNGLITLMGARNFGFSNRLSEEVKEWERAESERSEHEASGFTCISKTNSKWECGGLIDRQLAESILDLNPDITMDDLRAQVSSINGSVRALRASHWAS